MLCGNEHTWNPVLIIGRILYCSVEEEEMPLVLSINTCYNVVKLAISVIIIQVYLNIINLEELFIKININLILLIIYLLWRKNTMIGQK